MTYGTTPGEGPPDPAEQQPGSSQPTPQPAPMWPEGQYSGSPGQQGPPAYPQPAYGQPGYGTGGYFPPGYAAGPVGQQPPTYRTWTLIAAVGGVLFSLILGLPTALIALSYSRKVQPNWQTGNVQAAITASRKARTWVIASTILDLLGVVLLAVVIGAGHTTGPGSNSGSNFSNPTVVAASTETAVISSSGQSYYTR